LDVDHVLASSRAVWRLLLHALALQSAWCVSDVRVHRRRDLYPKGRTTSMRLSGRPTRLTGALRFGQGEPRTVNGSAKALRDWCRFSKAKYPADDEGWFMRRKSLPAAYSESPAARASRPQFTVADAGALLRRRAFFRALRSGAAGAVVSGLLASAKTSFGIPRPPATEDCVSRPSPASFLSV
jgi:hypothetical protein